MLKIPNFYELQNCILVLETPFLVFVAPELVFQAPKLMRVLYEIDPMAPQKCHFNWLALSLKLFIVLIRTNLHAL